MSKQRAPSDPFQVAKAMMTDAAVAMLASDPKRVTKAHAALAELRRVEAAMEDVRRAPHLSPLRRQAAIETLERRRAALVADAEPRGELVTTSNPFTGDPVR